MDRLCFLRVIFLILKGCTWSPASLKQPQPTVPSSEDSPCVAPGSFVFKLLFNPLGSARMGRESSCCWRPGVLKPWRLISIRCLLHKVSGVFFLTHGQTGHLDIEGLESSSLIDPWWLCRALLHLYASLQSLKNNFKLMPPYKACKK